MNISPVGVNHSRFNNFQKETKSLVETSNSTDLLSMNEVVGRSMINFKAQQLHRLDKIFIDNIASELNFSKENTTKLTQMISDFLKEGNYKSLGDLAGDEFFDVQCNFIDKVVENFGFSDDLTHEYFVSEFSNRCDAKDNYVPNSIVDFNLENIAFEDMVIGVFTSLANDTQKFNSVITANLGLDEAQSKKFKSIVSEYLNSHNLTSLKAMRGDDFINEQGELTSIISTEFNLSDNEEDILITEMVNFINSAPNKYTPMTTRIDKDFDMFDAICDKNGIDESLRADMYNNIKQIALKNGASSLFEVFTNPNIKDEYLDSLPTDLIIDLAVSKDNVNIIKHKTRDAFYDSVREDIILEKLQEKFGFSSLTLESLRSEIKNGKIKNIKQLAYEIADKYNLNHGAELEIEDIIQSADTLDYHALDVFLINKLKKLH